MTEMFQIMSWHYLAHQGQYFKPLCMVIGMMAIFIVLESWKYRRGCAPASGARWCRETDGDVS